MSGQLGQCGRCGVPLRVADPTPDAGMLRRVDKPKGQCVNCAVREWFYIYQAAVPDLDPRELLIPAIREQFERVMVASRSGAHPTEIDWPKVVRDWNLPITGAKKDKHAKKRANWSPPFPGSEWN